jgi:TetR/AcrR family fatty acid metabolism transcriptional regulator
LNEHSFSQFKKGIFMTGKRTKKEQIIEAAVEVFAQKGFFNAKVRDVAKKAEVADGTIYNYFRNKEDLLINLFEIKMEDILNQFRKQIVATNDPVENLRAFVALHFNIIKSDKKLAEVFQVELRQSTKFLKNYHNQKFTEYLNIIADIIERGKESGFFRQTINTQLVKLLIFGSIDEIARQWILGAEKKFTVQEAAEQVFEVLVGGIIT